MGGAGSGRKPKKRPIAEVIEESVADAKKVAARVPAPVKKTAPPKKAEAKPTQEERKKRKSRYPSPSEFTDNPLAQAFNMLADAKVGVAPGTAAKCQLGEAWMAVLDYYTGGVVDHPLAVATVATGSFAAVAFATAQAKKPKDGATKGPGSPAGGNAPTANAIPELGDAICPECGIVLPDKALMADHKAKDHAPPTEAKA